ncbi:hypothetical protein SERLADRAFT_404520 [Serpula lacrymans var. lacrymans S7.9]|uniref:hAT-like transposase RNase-H fold domain-containing protein n=1 Tax=Serpula lacrymans var. lacrymans (strain S7.9) TaxID=578457 RepID=F8NDD4_SERL9|nr:uncharacterized protein SERLADRAFT_404520 [Serpula lacrymans var. lacrymans S7.9]EGO30272.1 hypothetical protein SERLADRAFT_404520 [Serpula lacrymans var. lacrymans S7.9]
MSLLKMIYITKDCAIVCQEKGIAPLELIKWSMQAVNKSCVVADQYKDFVLSKNKWTLLELIKKVLFEPRFKADLKKLHKWYIAIDQADIYFICLALDPGVKLEYTQAHWDKIYHFNGLKALKKKFDVYVKKFKKSKLSAEVIPATIAAPVAG